MRKKDKVKSGKIGIPESQLEQLQSIISSAEREIYENINQCLCLARMQLGTVNLDDKEKSLSTIGEANLLIGKAVKDLRTLTKQLSLLNDNFK